ncbi:MAG: hemerythrin domain-containing protein [Thiotrichaceae bacterium]
MKRIEYLIKLSREHHISLVLAKRCVDVATGQDQQEIKILCASIVEEFPETWEKHFLTEEQSVLPVVMQFYPDLQELCHSLTDEHQQMRKMYEQMKEGDTTILKQFGELLRAHTRKEERELFPNINTPLFVEQATTLLSNKP